MVNKRHDFDPTRQWRGLPPPVIAAMQQRGSSNVSRNTEVPPPINQAAPLWTTDSMREMLNACTHENGCRVIASAILQLYRRQTPAEAKSQETTEQNGRGFNSADAQFLTSLAVQVIERRSARLEGRIPAGWKDLSERQFEFAKAKVLKYAGQLADIANSAVAERVTSDLEQAGA